MRYVSVIAVVIGLVTPAWAGFDEGLAAHDRGDHATAPRESHPLAGQGDSRFAWRILIF